MEKLTENDVLELSQGYIRKAAKRYGGGFAPEEKHAIAMEAYLLAMRSHRKSQSAFEPHVDAVMRKRFIAERAEKNRLMQIESSISLDMPVKDGENSERIGTVFFAKGYEFVDHVIFRDFLGGLPHELKQIARRLIGKDTVDEICEDLDISCNYCKVLIARIGWYWAIYNEDCA